MISPYAKVHIIFGASRVGDSRATWATYEYDSEPDSDRANERK